jgi:hypothetical protein
MNQVFRMSVEDALWRLHEAAEKVEDKFSLHTSYETEVLDAFRNGVDEIQAAIREGMDSGSLPHLVESITQHKLFSSAESELKELADLMLKL